MDPETQVTDQRPEITCDDCFFRQAQLCALPGNTPCPTFRPAHGALEQARRVTAAVPVRPMNRVPAAA